MTSCAWCQADVDPENPEVHFGVKLAPGVDLSKFEGAIGPVIPFKIVKEGITVFGVAVADDSPAKRAGYDLIFVVCCEKCAKELKAALRKDFGFN